MVHENNTANAIQIKNSAISQSKKSSALNDNLINCKLVCH